MSVPSRFAELPASDQWLIRQMQAIAYGRLSFSIQSGFPNPKAGYRVVRTQKLSGGSGGPRPEAASDDFALRDEHIALIRHLRTLADDTLVTLKVVHGLPSSSIDLEEEHRAA